MRFLRERTPAVNLPSKEACFAPSTATAARPGKKKRLNLPSAERSPQAIHQNRIEGYAASLCFYLEFSA
jgi:hypothetical protein